jgi:uncharacterized membrane protein
MMVLAAVLWLGTSWTDDLLTKSGALPSRWLYSDDRASVRSLLLTIAASTVGIVGVVFSIMMVPLTIAASQFGPRLLRNFLRDTGTQITLGTFTATFLFCMLVILQLREEPTQLLPQVSVSTGLLLGVMSFAMLIYFVNHIAISIQASVVVAEVSEELHQAIDHELPALPSTKMLFAQEQALPEEPSYKASTPHTVFAKESGYVQVRDDKGLLGFAQEQELLVQLLRQPGDFVAAYTPLALVWPKQAIPANVEDVINDAYLLGVQRTLVQDVTFGINSLVEVAVRALSPAINDPFTAMTCLDRLGAALCKLCSRSFPSAKLYDEHHCLRLITEPITFTSLADAAFTPIRDYGRSSTMVLLRLLDTLAMVVPCIRTEEQRRVLLHHAGLVERSAQTGLPDLADRQAVTERFHKVVGMLEARVKKEV